MKKLLIVYSTQFGYHTDTLFYCKYLKREFEVTYIGWDYDQEKVIEDGVRVVYVPRRGGKVQRLARLITTTLRELRTTPYDAMFVVYFRFCALLGLFGKCGVKIMDVRTGWILPGRLRRFAYNTGILLESFAFRQVSVITEELRKVLHLPLRKTHVIRLGAEIVNVPPKDFGKMSLLYVGTFQNRHIYKTVQGFDMFVSKMNGSIDAHYDIVGYGTPEDVRQMERTIEECKNKSFITYHGRIPHTKLRPFLLKCNIGVAFVPITPAQQPQPYTKVFEYLQAGMPVLATANDSNLKVINRENGVLFSDTVDGVYGGLKEMQNNLALYNSGSIAADAQRFSWSHVIAEDLKPYLLRLTTSKDRMVH